MLELKTSLSSVKLDKTITISRKGKEPLEIEKEKKFILYLHPRKDLLYIIIGVYKDAYTVKIDVSLTEDMVNEIIQWYKKDKPINDTTIRAKKITIKDFWER